MITLNAISFVRITYVGTGFLGIIKPINISVNCVYAAGMNVTDDPLGEGWGASILF